MLAAREGYRSVELLKRYTTLGMSTDQGKTSNINGHAIMAALTERAIPEVGTTTSRPPYSPVAIGAFAGHHRGKDFRPTRLTAGHGWARERGATFVEAGQWLRAQWFAAPGETQWQQTVSREVKAVRSGVGVCDVSTLGKIDIQGPDSAAFLDRLYINMFSTLPIARGALRADAARGRPGPRRRHHGAARRRALRHVDHHRERREGDAAPGARPAGALAGAGCADRLGHRAVVPICHRRSPLTSTAGAPARRCAGPLQRRISLSRLRAIHVARGPGAAVPHFLLRRDGLRARRSGALRRCRHTRHHRGGRPSSASLPTAPRRSESCASRRVTSPATSSTARRPPPTWGWAA